MKIFEAKERPFFDPLIVHLPDIGWLDRVATPRETLVQQLVDTFWPGPLTLVLPRRDVVPDVVASGLPTVAVRMSAHPVFRAVGERFGRPLAAPSANRFGRISPTCAEHVVAELSGRIPLILDGACGYGDDAPQLLEMLATEGVLVKAGGRYHWMAEAFPAENVSLRSAAIDNFVVIEQGPKPKVIAEVDRTAAPLLIH